MGSGAALTDDTRDTAAPFALEALDIEKSFGITHVLKKASLRVLPGEIHAFLGGNGAGKSTLIRIVSGFLKADGGRVLVDGAESYDPRRIAVVFQELRCCRISRLPKTSACRISAAAFGSTGPARSTRKLPMRWP